MTITIEVPREFSAQVFDLVEKYKILLPAWVRSLRVTQDHSVAAIAQITLNEVYGYATVTLGDAWPSCTDREAAIVHEFCHCYTIPISRIARDMMEDFFPDGPTPGTRMFDRVVQEANERCTCEMESLILRLMASRDLDSGAQI